MSNATSLLGSRATAASNPGRVPRTQSPLTAWVTDVVRRLGTRLLLTCDEEANWRGWQTTVLRGGLARSYRDPRFDLRQQVPGPGDER
jgi:hypothetical protein